MAVVLACATFPLIWVGGLVTTYDAGMAVPDWPTTYGYNLFLYPWQTWLFGPFDLFIEHGHRLLGALAGLLTIGLVIAVWRGDQRPWMRVVAVAALAAVVGQGLLGGLRVRMDARHLAMLHGCFGPAFFALVAAIVVFTSRWWRSTIPAPKAAGGRLLPIALLTLGLAYGQLVIGAFLRHTPVDAPYSYFRGAVFFHLFLAAALVAHVVVLALNVGKLSVSSNAVRRMSRLLVGLVIAQVSLGIATWVVKYGWPAWFSGWSWTADYTVRTNTLAQSWLVTAHVANGSLILAASAAFVAIVARSYGLESLRPLTGELLPASDRDSEGRRFARVAVEPVLRRPAPREVRR